MSVNQTPVRKVGFVWHERYGWHDTGNWAGMLPSGGLVEPYRTFEKPETKRRLYSLLGVSGMLDHLTPIAPRPATRAELTRFHTGAYLDQLEALSAAGGGEAGEAAPMGPDSWPIACLSAGGAIEATESVLSGRTDMAYALTRPPGHHAERDRARGFCFLGNTALAAHHALAAHGLQRIAIVDWDVHHGNGTEQAFYDDPRVLTISLHQDRLYPIETGQANARGEGEGFGTNINIPLPPGSGEGAYLCAMDRLVLPALERFQPELILIACGFDACLFDPLSHTMLAARSYRAMTERVITMADKFAKGRLVAIHEGGYSAEYVPFCGLATLETMTGINVSGDHFDFVDAWIAEMPSFQCEPAQREIIESYVSMISDVPPPA